MDKIIENFSWTDASLLLLLLLLLLLILLRGCRGTMKKLPASARMFGYSLLYADQKQSGAKQEGFGKLLHSEAYALQGKPDYIYKKRFGKAIVPVELKSGSIGEEALPHRGDLLQLAAYFLLLEDVYQVRPKFGKLVYRDYMFVVKNTRGLRKEVGQTMKAMREMLLYGVGKANASFVTCRHCICNGTVCTHSGTKIIGGKADESSCGEE